MKKETLEEAAEKYINDDLDLYESLVDGHISYNIGIDLLNKLFIAGAKYQAERMYSEEEVITILDSYNKYLKGVTKEQSVEEWFEQFKKK